LERKLRSAPEGGTSEEREGGSVGGSVGVSASAAQVVPVPVTVLV
jgi:hypothetical protein